MSIVTSLLSTKEPAALARDALNATWWSAVNSAFDMGSDKVIITRIAVKESNLDPQVLFWLIH